MQVHKSPALLDAAARAVTSVFGRSGLLIVRLAQKLTVPILFDSRHAFLIRVFELPVRFIVQIVALEALYPVGVNIAVFAVF